MSKVNINYDTETYKMDVMVDGKSIQDITSISIYGESDKNGEKEYYINLFTSKVEGEVVINTTYYVMSSLVPSKATDKSLAGFLGHTEKDHTKSLSKFLNDYL